MKAIETAKKMFKKLNLDKISHYDKLKYFLYFVALLIIISAALYYNAQITKKDKQITKMTRNLSVIPISLYGINGTDGQFQYKLRDYYIASSYNSCCAGEFLDDYVSLDALLMFLKEE